MARYHTDWLTAFMDYASFGEAPRHMYFWAGASAIAGALRRKVWIDQAYFKWYPNMYVILVAPPGIVSKSTTAGISMSLLRQVPGIKFGPDVVTWPALVSSFAASTEAFEYNGEYLPMSALTLESSEFGNLLNPQDKEMVDLLVSLWDGKQGAFKKETKHSGNDVIENPWINLIACTTPAWIAGNFPEYMVGGGFTSRCVFVYADQKAKYVAYPGLRVPRDLDRMARELVADLTEISGLVGEYKLTPSAIAWGEAWYQKHYTVRSANLNDDRFGGYIARKQTHIHKLAMILAASQGTAMWVTEEHLAIADQMVTDLEPDMQFVFARIGKTDTALYAERLIAFVHQQKVVGYQEAYRYVHTHFPSMRDFEDIVSGCVRAGYIKLEARGGTMIMVALAELAKATNGEKKEGKEALASGTSPHPIALQG